MIQENYCLYIHTNKTNNKKYVGVTSKLPEQRWGKNGAKYKSSTHFWSAIQKYGWDNFYHDVIQTGLTKEEAFNLEREYIKKLRTQDPDFGYNISDGGETGPALRGPDNPNFGKQRTLSHCLHLSESLKDHPVSDITKKRISENNRMSRKVRCVETDEVFNTLTSAADFAGVSISAICRVLHKQRNTSGGYHWEYVSEKSNDYPERE